MNWTCLEIRRWKSGEQKGLEKQICGNTSITDRVKRKAKVLRVPCSAHRCDEDDEMTEKRKQWLPRGRRTLKV